MSAILSSEFLWGVIIGLLLSMVVAAFSAWLETFRRRRIVVDFCDDLIGSICDYIQNLEDNRQRNRVIDNEFIAVILAEVTVYGRNREHLPIIGDVKLRNDVREFFTRVAALLTQVQSRLTLFTQAHAQSQTPGPNAASAQQAATAHLADAHKAVDRLVDLLPRRKDLQDRLHEARRLFPRQH